MRDATVARLERYAPWAILAYAAVTLTVSVGFHPTPLYYVETDLVGEYIPAASSLASGRLDVSHYGYKGPGYPLLLAIGGIATGGDWFLAARLLSAIAAAASVVLGFLLVRGFAPAGVALFALGGLIANPTLLRYAVEAGTDTPALAAMLAAALLVLRARSPRAALVAGAVAGYAVLMRGNAVSLLPAAAVVLACRAGRRASLAAFATGACVPLAAWAGVHLAASGRWPVDRNYLNVAYELYGRTVPWEVFEARNGARFDSMWSVVAFDPRLAVVRIGANLAVHRIRDLAELLPVWIGLCAAPGAWLMARDRSARPALAFAGFGAIALAAVFYSTRFALFLLPFELAAAGYALVAAARQVGRRVPAPFHAPALAGVIAALLVTSSVVAGRDVHRFLVEAPYEVREAGGWLAAHVPHGATIVARKPHVAWYGGLESVPFPSGGVRQLLAGASAAHADYVFYSPIEAIQRPECAVLADSGLDLPGLEQVAYRTLGRHRFYAVYRLTGERAQADSLDAALEAALLRYANRRADRPDVQVFAAAQLVGMGRHRLAVERLEPLVRNGVRDAGVAALLSSAYLGLGDLDRAYAACEQAVRIGPETAWQHARLGTIRSAQRRVKEARAQFERAVALEPGNPEHHLGLGLAGAAMQDFAAAARAFEDGLRLAPDHLALRRYAIGAHARAGHAGRATELLRDAERAGLRMDLLLDPASAGPAAGIPRR